MEYRIALSPELGISPEEFAEAWNEAPDCRQAAQAKTREVQGGQFMAPEMLLLLQVVETLSAAVAGAALYDLIKQAMAKWLGPEKAARSPIQIEEQRLADGTRVIIIREQDAS